MNREYLSTLGITHLKNIAKQYHIEGYSKYKLIDKDKLIDLILIYTDIPEYVLKSIRKIAINGVNDYIQNHPNYYFSITNEVIFVLKYTFLKNEKKHYATRHYILAQLSTQFQLNEQKAKWLLEVLYICMKEKQNTLLQYCDLIPLEKYDYKPLYEYYEGKKAWCRLLYFYAHNFAYTDLRSLISTIKEKKDIQHPIINLLFIVFNLPLKSVPNKPNLKVYLHK